MILAEPQSFYWGKEILANLSAFFWGLRNQRETWRVSEIDDNSGTFEMQVENLSCAQRRFDTVEISRIRIGTSGSS